MALSFPLVKNPVENWGHLFSYSKNNLVFLYPMVVGTKQIPCVTLMCNAAAWQRLSVTGSSAVTWALVPHTRPRGRWLQEGRLALQPSDGRARGLCDWVALTVLRGDEWHDVQCLLHTAATARHAHPSQCLGCCSTVLPCQTQGLQRTLDFFYSIELDRFMCVGSSFVRNVTDGQLQTSHRNALYA